MLEQFIYMPLKTRRINKLKTFLEANKNLKEFKTYWTVLWTNRNALMKTKVKLQLLTICLDTPARGWPLIKFVQLLQILHVHKFYEALSFSSYEPNEVDNEHTLDAIFALPFLTTLTTINNSLPDTERLINLQELVIAAPESRFDTENELVKNIPELTYFSILLHNH